MAVSTTTPTAEQVAVPETLLKKRRSTEKSREEKLAKAAEAQKVSTDGNIVEDQDGNVRCDGGRCRWIWGGRVGSTGIWAENFRSISNLDPVYHIGTSTAIDT